jgi:hypothetical protein
MTCIVQCLNAEVSLQWLAAVVVVVDGGEFGGGSGVPAVADLQELGLEPAAAAAHGALHLGLHAQHLVLGHALLALHLRVRPHPVRRPGHAAALARARARVRVRHLRVLAAREHAVVPSLHHHESPLAKTKIL